MLAQLPAELKKVTEHLKNEFAKLQVGRANPALVDDISVSAYGNHQPLKNCASVSVLDAQTLSISPWDKSLLRDISKGISDSGIGLNPQDNGESITLRIPPMTEDRRRDLTKFAKKMSEEAKVSVRNIRQDHLKRITNAKNAKEISEDIAKQNENDLQKQVDAATKSIDEMLSHKEVEIMKI